VAVPDGSVIISKKKISQKFSGFENLSSVGEIKGFNNAKTVVILEGSNLALVQRREGMRKQKPSRVRYSQPPGSVFPAV